MAVRCADCTRRQYRNREASETRFAQTADASFSDFGTGDVSPSNGFHCNGNGNGNGNGNRNSHSNRNGNSNSNSNGTDNLNNNINVIDDNTITSKNDASRHIPD